MKIFNWVHRRFNNKLAENEAKKNGLIAADHKQLQFVVENNTSVFERWRGGILTIGTFGYDPLKDQNEENDVCFYHQEESDKEHLLSEEYRTDLIAADFHEEEEEEEEEEEVEINEQGQGEEDANPLDIYAAACAREFERLMEGRKRVVDEESEFEFFEFGYVMLEKKKARTTLADLFSADTEELQKKQQQEEEEDDDEPIDKLGETAKQKANNYCKQQGFSFGKKHIADEARPIHKLHQLMRRMLKRKIHPDDHASLLP